MMNSDMGNKKQVPQTGPSNTPNNKRPIGGQPTGSFHDSLNNKPTKDGSPKSSHAGSWALDKAANLHPALKAAKKAKDFRDSANNPLRNIRAKKGPQMPPQANDGKINPPSSLDGDTKDGVDRDIAPKKNNFLPSGPKFLDDQQDDDLEDLEQSNLATLRSIFGGGRRKGKGNIISLIKGTFSIKTAAIAVAVSLLFLIFCGMGAIVSVIANKNSPIGIADGNSSYQMGKEEKAFKERLDEVVAEYQEDGKTVDPKMIGAVYIILSSYGVGYDYKKMTKSEIKEIADLMFDSDGNYSEDTFKNNLETSYFPRKIKGKSDITYKRYVKEVFEALDEYKEDQKGGSLAATGQTGGVCTYTINGMNTELYGTGIKNETMTVSNLMVRLMSAGGMCDGVYNQALDDGELIPFEKYVLGVALEEIGPDAPEEAFKAQMIVARTFALTVPAASGFQGGRKLYQENGQWILQISNCVTDQVYCDPDKGCSRNTSCSNQYGVMHVGVNTASNACRQPIPENSPLRQYANEVAGKVALDASGKLYLTNFKSTEQNQMISYAKSGYDYTQILMKIFPSVTTISESNCTDVTTGSYTGWKQAGSKWSSVALGGGKSIGEIGCLATSISILAMKSGAVDALPAPSSLKADFNPGTFVEAMNKVGGFDSGGRLYWARVANVLPNFVYAEDLKTSLSGLQRQEKLDKIKELSSANNQYCVVEVKGSTGEHWVAVDKVENGSIKMFDPGTKATDMWKQYDWNNTSTIQCYKKV